jgi:NAD(P)-dependent dehydrogenase (short-subunit alcohol dehydrogenase family)
MVIRLERSGGMPGPWSPHEYSVEIHGDATNLGLVRRTVLSTVRKFGKIDVLVNSVGKIIPRPLMSMGEADWDSVLDTNAKSAFL